MALLTSDITRLKYELGFSTLAVGAEPYIGIAAVFDQVVRTYAASGAVTTSATAVTAASSPTPVTLTLASPTGFAQFVSVIVDVDARQERATVSAVSGSTIVVQLSKTHSGTYPVTVEGSESIIRDLLWKLAAIDAPGGLLEKAASTAGLRKVDEVEFFGESGSISTRLAQVARYREYLRDELWMAVFGTPRRSSGARLTVY